MVSLTVTFVTIVLQILCTHSYKILVYSPTVSRSHMVENGRIADSLAKDNHNVTVLAPHLFVEPEAFVSVHKANFWPVRYNWPARLDNIPTITSEFHYNILTDAKELFDIQLILHDACLHMLDTPGFVQQVQAEHYDAIFYEQYTPCPVILAELAGIEVRLLISSLPIAEHHAALMAIPAATSYVPTLYNSPHMAPMGFLERFSNTLRSFVFSTTYHLAWMELDKSTQQRYGKLFPTSESLFKTADLTFINTDELVDYPRPIPPNVIHIGGLGDHHVNTTLPAPYDGLLQQGRKGVVYFSLGSIVRTNALPDGYMNGFLEAFEEMKDYFFIVKLAEKDVKNRQIAKHMKNVYVADWAPQTAILAHPRLKLFITHGGYNSIMEAASLAKPVLSMGVLYDQPRNSRVVEKNGWGLSLDKMSLQNGPAEFKEKLHRLLTDPSFEVNAQRISRMLKTKPQTGEQRLLSYVRFLEENGGHLPELHSIAPHLSFIEYYNLDVYAFILTLFSIFSLATLVMTIRVFHFTTHCVITGLSRKKKID